MLHNVIAKKLHMTVLAIALLLIAFPTVLKAEWQGSVFESEIEIIRSPDHTRDRAPFDMEPFHITITSKNGQFINAADVRFTWSYQGRLSPEGGYSLTRVNQTSMEGSIPGHPGGSTINYRIVAYDEKNTPLTSPQYSYTVLQNGSFSGSDFDINVALEWGPKEPRNYQNVQLNISSRDPLVTISRGDLFYTVAIPGQDPVDGVTFFGQGEGNGSLSAELIFYPPGSRISFRVEAYDTYMNKVVSATQTYEYPRLPPAQPVYTGYIFVQFKDMTRNGPPDGSETLKVVFSNETYLHETEARSGIAYTNTSVYQGTYRIEAEYMGETYTWTVSVPRPDGSFSFLLEINEKTYSVPFEHRSGPTWKDAIGLLMLVSLLALAYVGAGRIKDYYRKLAEDKKRRRRAEDKEEVHKWYDRMLKDEGKKDMVLRAGAFLVLSFLGLVWAPFYPWWAVILFCAVLTALAIRFPYLSLLIISVLVTASTAYQSREFGWVFLMLSLVAMVGGFFDWRYGYLTLLTVFASGFGIGFAVPIAVALTISLLMGSLVLVTAGIFLLVIAPSGNFDIISLLSSQGGKLSFVTFSRPVPSMWSPVDLANAVSSITTADMNTISRVLSETMGDLTPLLGLLSWAGAMVLSYYLFTRYIKGKEGKIDVKGWALRASPGALLFLVALLSYVLSTVEFNAFTVFALLTCFPASLLAFVIRDLGEASLPMYFGVEEIKSSDVGVKISEMVNFRKATFKDIGGLEDVKREVKNAIMVPLLEPDMATKYGVKPSKGILLFGPPGCGKTLMLRAVASDLNVDMIGIKCSDVMSKWYGESENLIASLFKEAKARSPCILFLDEIDSIAKRRDFYSTDDVTPRVLSIMLSEMDGMEGAEGVIIVATTNMPDLVDPALMRPGRFDKVIYIPPPDAASRKEILSIHLQNKYVSKDIAIEDLAKRTEGFSGADLANLVAEASALGLEKALQNKKSHPISMGDIEAVLGEIKPSVTTKTLKMYDKLRREYERKIKGGNNARSQAAPGGKEELEPTDVKWED